MSNPQVTEALHGIKVRIEMEDGIYHIMTKQGKEWKTVATAKKYKDMLSELKQLRSKK